MCDSNVRSLLVDLTGFCPTADDSFAEYERASLALRPLIDRTAALIGPQILAELSFHPNDARNELLAAIEAWMER